MLEYTKEALQDLADRITRGEHPPIPVYDSDDPETRKKIGMVTKVWYEDGSLKYQGKLD